MVRRWMLWCVLLLAAAPTALLAQQRAPDSAENRTALVIGNANYKDAPLANPLNDARAVAKALGEAGFQVKLRTNLTQAQMRRAIREFGDELHEKKGVGLFYFAGHGVQLSNRNFLIPVGADIQREYEVEDQAVDASSVLAMMESAKARVNIVILDACRNNPFMRNFRSTINGLAPMQAPAGTLVAFSTAPGQTAIDGAGQYGLYTEHLVENLAVPGLKIEDVFKNVRVSVQRVSNGKQVPWENTSLTGDFFFRVKVTVEIDDAALRRAQQEDINKAVQTALRKREEEEAARRATQQGEIEQAVLAALKKREDEQAAAQAARSAKETAEAKAAVERLNKELAELRVAQGTASQPPAATSPPSAAPISQVAAAQQPAIPPIQIALAAPSAARAKPVVTVGGRVGRPEIRVGDQWKYVVTDRYTDLKNTFVMEVATVTENRIYTRSAQASDIPGDLTAAAGAVDVWDRDWNQLRQGQIEYAPLYPFAKFPLEAESKWTGVVKFDSGGVTLIHDVTAQVAGWERVTVPAGTFDAVRINLRGYFRAVGIGGTGSIIDTYWYAPVARQFVKKEFEHHSSVSGGAMGRILSPFGRYERWELVEYKAN